MLLLGVIFVTLIAGSVQSVTADHLFEDENVVNHVSTKDSKYQIHVQVQVRNEQGQLVSISEGTHGKYIPLEITNYVFNEKLGKKGQFFDKTDWVAFKKLQNITPNSLEFLMFQASTIFTFYHEFAHLVQYKGKVFSINEHSFDDTYSFEKHVFEYDADLNGCQFVSVYFQQFFQEQIPREHQTENNYKRLMYLGISSIVITQLLFLYGKIYPFQPQNLDTDFYTRKKSHPHTLVRAKYIIEHYVGIAKANGVKIDFGDTTSNITIICNEFFKDSGVFKDFILGFQNHFDEINAYSLDLFIGQRDNKNCIKHKIELFGFTLGN